MKGTLFTAAIAGAVGVLFATTTTPTLAQDVVALAKSKNCFACHAVDKKVVGPAYKDVAKKFANDANAVAELSKRIKEGSSGVWGVVPMPPNSVTEAEAKTLAEWVMSQK